MGSISVEDSDIFLYHARDMLNISSFTKSFDIGNLLTSFLPSLVAGPTLIAVV